MPLDEYRRRRDFTRTPEPRGGEAGAAAAAADAVRGAEFAGWQALPPGRRFCVQMHRATRLHFDLRLEHAGVLLSWAVPRGPSLDPTQRRLAVHVEDHPVEYGEFEGVIPSGYGAGTVMLWDAGAFAWSGDTAADVDFALRKGHVRFVLDGIKLRGEFDLFRTGQRRRPGAGEWLLVKRRDNASVPGMEAVALDWSIKTRRSLARIASDEGGDPKHPSLAGEAVAQELGPLLEAAPAGELPRDAELMLATPVDKAFSRDGWLFELKYDGVRTLATLSGGHVTLRGRRGRDETARYPEVAGAADALRLREAVLDGEVVALDAEGRPSFERLQSRINVQHPDDIERARQRVPATFVVFDLLYADGHDLRPLPLRQRKQVLRTALRSSPRVLLADHIERDGEAFFAALKQRGLEGMVGKLASSRYVAGRSLDWVKVKAWNSQTCVICGYTAGRRSRRALGALVLGIYEEGVLRHAGQVGTGFDEATLRTLRTRLDAITLEGSPIVPAPATDQPATWVRPELVCEVRFTEWTQAGTLRHPAYTGLRPDVAPTDCVRERPASPDRLPAAAPPPEPEVTTVHAPAGDGRPPAPRLYRPPPDIEEALSRLPAVRSGERWEVAGRAVRLTNPDKVLWPEDGLTKRDMVAHYVRMAPLIIPYLRDRPLSTQVFPDGIHGKSFWRKDKPAHAPPWIRSWTYRGEDAVKEYILVEEPATLAWVANAGVIDLHPWHSRHDAPNQPDWAVFDLDPFEPATFADVVKVAKLVKAALDHYGLRSVVKTSGQTGLQIYVPVRRGPDYGTVLHWVEDVARAIGRVIPDTITWEWSVSRRTGRIRIDYTQNIINKTLAGPYSLRPSPGAPVSTPIAWEELDDPALRPDRWTIHTIAARVAEVGDLFGPVLEGTQDLPLS